MLPGNQITVLRAPTLGESLLQEVLKTPEECFEPGCAALAHWMQPNTSGPAFCV